MKKVRLDDAVKNSWDRFGNDGIDWRHLHGERFRAAFDKAFGLEGR